MKWACCKDKCLHLSRRKNCPQIYDFLMIFLVEKMWDTFKTRGLDYLRSIPKFLDHI